MWISVRAGVLMLILVACAAPALAQGLGSRAGGRAGGDRAALRVRADVRDRVEAAQIVSALSFLPPSSTTEVCHQYQRLDRASPCSRPPRASTGGPRCTSRRGRWSIGSSWKRATRAASGTSRSAWRAARRRAAPPRTSRRSAATTGSPGCAFFPLSLTAPTTVDNRNNNYWLFVDFGTSDTTNRVLAIRVFYRLQVSPAPAVATFPSDVPTATSFFRFIEALARAGVTAGCGPGAYCPGLPR